MIAMMMSIHVTRVADAAREGQESRGEEMMMTMVQRMRRMLPLYYMVRYMVTRICMCIVTYIGTHTLPILLLSVATCLVRCRVIFVVISDASI